MLHLTRTLFILLITCLPVHTAAQQAAPGTFLFDPAVLTAQKAAIATHQPGAEKALHELLTRADRALQHGPYAVTFKSKVPPSGDKHDYMSVGPYWWPDSAKANGLPYIRRDGVTNPERYTIKDDSYFNALCNDVNVLGLAWFYTGKEQYATKAVALLHTWFLDPATRMNPNLNYGQAIPGITEGRGIGLIDTHAVIALMDGMQLLKDSPAFPVVEYKSIQDWFRQFLTWMRTSKIGKEELAAKNNHGTWYDVQAVAMALFTGQQALAKQLLLTQTKQRMEQQFEADGRQPLELERTLSWNYSYFNLKAFFELALMAEKIEVDLWNYESPGKKSLRKAFQWMLPFAAGNAAWQYRQIKPMQADGYLELAAIAEKKYPDLDLTPLWKAHPKDTGYAYTLTGWGE
ncbi:hypothetical protein QFZ48_001195 [Chitinophaga sp. W2I13]|uniref:alginate lyase family protein n=1 Tax=Chitinophaga sp. W2I13 TaxID=3373923 RepID=UPI003D19DA9C